MKLIQVLFAVAMFAALSGCSSSGTSISYYLIDPTKPETTSSHESLAIEILDLSIPQYLERFQIASRTTTNQLVFSDSHQWGENLRKNLLRTMTRNLSESLGTIDIGSPVTRTLSTPDYRVQVYIEQFERVADGRVLLAARWQVSDGETGEPLSINSTELTSRDVGGASFGGVVDAMQSVYGELCDAIAKSIAVELGDA